MDKKEMFQKVYSQLAVDYNCDPEDFLKDGLIFTEAKELKGRRPFPFIEPRLEMITFGDGVVINASSVILPVVRDKLEGKTRYEVLNMPFVYGINPYYLPNLNNISLLNRDDSFLFEFIEKNEIPKLYQHKGFNYALQYNLNSLHTEHLAVIAKHKKEIIGIASAVAECEKLWQINVDVLHSHRGNNVATTMVNMLTIEVLKRGKIPYYSTDSGNVISQRVAVKSGYLPAWSHCYRTRLDLL